MNKISARLRPLAMGRSKNNAQKEAKEKAPNEQAAVCGIPVLPPTAFRNTLERLNNRIKARQLLMSLQPHKTSTIAQSNLSARHGYAA